MNLTNIHPVVFLFYYVILIMFALLFNDLYYLLSFLVFILVLLYLQGISSEIKAAFKYFIPMSLIIIILNPLFSNVGTTKILFFNGFFISLESLTYGFLMVFSLLIILLLFLSFNKYMDYQKLLYLSSNHFPNVSMIMIMAMRFIPYLKYRLEEVSKIFNFDRDDLYESRIDKVINKGSILAIIISLSLEETMLTAKSMKARGYGITKRTNYLKYNINKIDISLILLIFSTAFICLVGLYYGNGNAEIYPTLNSSFFKLPLNMFYLAFIILLIPFIFLELKERIIWKYRGGDYGFNKI